MKSSMTQATHGGMIKIARFPRNEFGAGYLTTEKQL